MEKINRPEIDLMDSKKLEHAENYWHSRLETEHRIETSQNAECIFSIVIPVYNEKKDRIKKQIDSLRSQSLDSKFFEIIYVVNNGVIDEESDKADVLAQNKSVIDFINSITDFPVYVVDKSSKGNEIPDCNVGKARNRGVAEASLRFNESGKNGILIQTDADSYFEDLDYLAKIRSTFQESPDVIGIAGGLIFEFDPDTDIQEKRIELEEKVRRFILIKKFGILSKFLKKGKLYSPFNDNTFSGANMISKSFETAVIGGLVDESSGEDPQFSKDLIKYGEQNNKKVIGMKDELRVVTALRDSDRTPSSFKKVFDNIDLSKQLEIDGQIVTPELIQTYEDEARKRPEGDKLLDNMQKMIDELRFVKK